MVSVMLYPQQLVAKQLNDSWFRHDWLLRQDQFWLDHLKKVYFWCLLCRNFAGWEWLFKLLKIALNIKLTHVKFQQKRMDLDVDRFSTQNCCAMCFFFKGENTRYSPVQRQRGKRTQSNFDKEFHIGHKQIMMHLQYLIHVDSTQIPLASSSHHRAGVIWSEGRSQGDKCPYILCLDSHVTFNSSFTVFSLFPLKTQPVARQVHGQASCKTKPKCRWTQTLTSGIWYRMYTCACTSILDYQYWPFQEPKLEVPTI